MSRPRHAWLGFKAAAASYVLLVVLFPSLSLVNQAAAQEAEAPFDLASFIPDEHLVAGVWQGRALDDPSITESDRQILNDEVVRFYSSLLQAVPAIMQDALPEVIRQEWQGPELSESLLSTPIAFYVRVDEVDMEKRPSIGLIAANGPFADFLDKAVRAVVANEGGGPLERLRLQENKFSRIEVGGNLKLIFGSTDTHFMLTIGSDDEAEQAIERMGQGVSERWAALSARTQVDRPWGWLSADGAFLIEESSREANEESLQGMKLLGIDRLGSVMVQVGFDDQGYRHRTFVELKKGPTGLLSLFAPGDPSQPLPPLATDRAATIVSHADLIGGIGALITEATDSGPNPEAPPFLSLLNWSNAFGPGIVIQHSPEDGGWLGGLLMAMPVRDLEQAQEVVASLNASLQEQAMMQQGDWWAPQFFASEYRDHQINHYVPGGFSPVEIAWSLTDSAIVFGIDATALKPTLDRIDGVLPAAEAMPIAANEGLVLDLNAERLLGTPQGVIQFVSRVALMEMRWQIDQEFATLAVHAIDSFPSGATMALIDRDDRLAITAVEDGLEIEGRFSLPGSEFALIGGTGVGLAMLAEESGIDPLQPFFPTRRYRSITENNLKQIALSMHNYHDAYGRFPGAFSKSPNGKSLLSWRVQLLPYLEQGNLYDQFHHDEPWDSPHNLALLEMMPEVYKAPGSQAEAGHTNYVVILDDEAIFDTDGTPRGFVDITDGTSNTLLVVEANDNAAVAWTRPDDLIPDMDLMTQLLGLRGEEFPAAIADGSVRWFDGSIDPEMLRAWITRSGGEVVEW